MSSAPFGLPSADSFASPVEDYAPSQRQETCDPTKKPGVVAFRDMLLKHVGGRDAGITRGCDQGGMSEHKEGRAWDWGMRADDAVERSRADDVLAWLLLPDAAGNQHAMFRRAGLQYVIWDGRIWSVMTESWTPYSGPNPHVDHVHFTFWWDGAMGRTSLFSGDRSSLPIPPPIEAGPPDQGARSVSWSGAGLAVVGAALGFAFTWWLNRRR